MSCRTFLLITFVIVAVVLVATPALAQTPTRNCIQNEWNISQGNSSTCTSSSCTLGCTANDVSIAEVVNVRDLSGNAIVNCQAGQPFTFIADFEIKTTSKSSRSNIGMYIALTGTTKADALSVNNSCADNIIPPPPGFTNTNTTGKTPTIGANGHFTCAGSTSIQCGTDYFDELDQATTSPADNCGDTSSTDAGGFGVGTQKVTLEIQNFTCPNPDTTTLPTCTVNGVTGPCAVLPNCTSWQVPGQTTLCVAPTGQQSYPLTSAGIPEAVPGTSSKCNCGVITLPVIAQKPSVTVAKSCVTSDTPAPASGSNVACSSGREGVDEVTYTVTVTNTSNFGSITVTQITDSVYGAVLGTGTFTGDSTACTSMTIAAGSSSSCTFTAHKYGDPGTGPGQATVTDTVSVSGTSAGGAFGPTTSNSVTVTPVEAPSAATVTKGLGSPNLTAGCATANFTVDVANTSNTTGCPTGGCDETESLTGLSDSAYTNITSVNGSVLGTTCGVATGSAGLGTLSGLTGGGTLPASLAPGAHYQCEFNAQFCGALQTVEEFGTGKCTNGTCSQGKTGSCSVDSDCDLTCTGLSHVNTVTATILGDEGAGDVVTPTGNNTLTVNVCLNPFTQASH